MKETLNGKIDNNAILLGDANTSPLRFIEHLDRGTIKRELEQHCKSTRPKRHKEHCT